MKKNVVIVVISVITPFYINKNKELIYYTFITLLHFIHLVQPMPDLLFLTFENLIPVGKQLHREIKWRLSVFWSREFAGNLPGI
jgi:hypothetical protein